MEENKSIITPAFVGFVFSMLVIAAMLVKGILVIFNELF